MMVSFAILPFELDDLITSAVVLTFILRVHFGMKVPWLLHILAFRTEWTVSRLLLFLMFDILKCLTRI